MSVHDSDKSPRFIIAPALVLVLMALGTITLWGAGHVASSAGLVATDEITIQPLGHFGGWLAAVAVPPAGGDYAYLGEGSGFTVLDVSDPGQPRQAGSLPLDGTDVSDITILDATAYLVNGSGLRVVDLSEPISPTLVGELDLPGTTRAVGVADSHAYVAAAVGWTDGWMYAVDLSDPAAPFLAGSYDTPGTARGIYAAGSTAYVADGDSGLLILDVSDLANPSLLGSYDTPDPAHVVQVVGATAYLLTRSDFPSYDGWLHILDVSDPASPTLLGSYDLPGTARNIQVVDTTAYVADGASGLHILDVSNPGAPVLLGTSDAGWPASKVAVFDTRAYLASEEKGVRILDVSNPASPNVLGDYERPTAVMDVIVDHPYGYIAGWDKFWVVDMTDPALPVPLGASGLQAVPEEGKRLSLSSHPQTGDPLAYVAEQYYGLEIFDVADPENPALIGQHLAPVGGEMNDVFAAGQYAYVLTLSGTFPSSDGWLRILDVSDPANPTEIGAFDTPGDAQRVFVAGGVAYVADGEAGLRFIDVSAPTSPVELGHIAAPTGASTDVVFVSDGPSTSPGHLSGQGSGQAVAFVGSNTESGWWLQTFDVSDPANPTLVAEQQGAGQVNDIDVDEEYVYLAVTGTGGSLHSLTATDLVGPNQPGQETEAGMHVYRKNDLSSEGRYRTEGADSVHRFSFTIGPIRFTFVIIDKKSEGIEITEIKTVDAPTPTPTPTPIASWVKVSSPAEIAPGQEIQYTITLRWDSWDGSSAPSNMVDEIPDYTEYVQGSATANIGAVRYDSSTNSVRWLGEIADEDAAIISFKVRIPCGTLMTKKISQWPDEIRNRGAGVIGPFGYSVARNVTLLKPDLTITGLEVTQAIQNLDNDVRLVKDKETYVRLYIKAKYPGDVEGCDVPNVTAQLEGGGSSALDPINDSITARVLPGEDRPTLDERDDLKKSLYFRLPRPWRTHDYRLAAEVNPDGDRPDSNTGNNGWWKRIEFVSTRKMYVYIYRVKYAFEGKTLVPTKSDVKTAPKGLRAYPISDEKRKIRWKGTTEYGPDVDEDHYALFTWAGQTGLVLHIADKVAWYNSKKTDYFVGVLHKDVDTRAIPGTGQVTGLGERPGYASWVKMDPDVEEAGLTMAHELGHNLGRQHVDCPPGQPSGPDTAYPYPSCQISNGQRDDYYGFDTNRPNVNVRRPLIHGDLMSYSENLAPSRPRWISDYTYNAIYQRLRATVAKTEAASAYPDERLLVSGIISPTTATADLDYVYRFDNPFFQNEVSTGPYTLELQNIAGQTLITDTFDVHVELLTDTGEASGSTDITGALPFLRALPYDERAVRLVLKQDDAILATRIASAHPPTVTITSPNGGEVITDTMTLTWNAADEDGDPLEYVVQYSADGGVTWQPVAIHLTATSYTMDTAELPGSDECLIRVAASDGFYTAYDQSDGLFSAPRKGPTVLIMDPEEGQVFAPGEWVLLTALAYDQEDEDLTDENLIWTSDKDGPLGAGSEVALPSLTPGWHTLTLTGTDAQGLMNEDSVHILVGYRAWLPLIDRP